MVPAFIEITGFWIEVTANGTHLKAWHWLYHSYYHIVSKHKNIDVTVLKEKFA